MLLKLTEMEQNWIIFTPYSFIKNLQHTQLRDSHMKFTKKNKVGNTTWAKYAAWLVKNGKIVFSKLTRKISLSVYQASKHLASSFPFSDFYTLSSLLVYFSGIFCTFHFGQMFNGFLTSTFDFYWSFVVQFSCIMTIRLSDGKFLFIVASN